ncbi:translation factor GUF1 homolog, chloroplastic-like isoform X3 [Musa acuminata AAA Group]|uniref:translation factor GUF1 homolog, chloroplastic-like isoform X3 n=1 Tax=Musa acuminata AAA Group TaxID=214697 RepID=UPI0031D49C24
MDAAALCRPASFFPHPAGPGQRRRSGGSLASGSFPFAGRFPGPRPCRFLRSASSSSSQWGMGVRCRAAGTESKAASDAAVRSGEPGQDRLLKVPVSNIRNFCIIAHIDHGKSTLADKLLQLTGTVQMREMKEQFLDNMDLERERGITIKLQAARMRYVLDNEPYCLNLIDTPGHVDFSYEVSRSLAACEGALLVVDASQGVEAQTLANVYLALENNLEIIPVLNKIDLPGAEPDRVAREMEEIIGLDCSTAIQCSAKEGIGIAEILNSIVTRIPPPNDTSQSPLRALIFDSYYDPYRGVIVYFRVVDGSIRKGDKIYFMASGKDYFADEIGVLSPNQMQVDELYVGEVWFEGGLKNKNIVLLVGYLSASIRSVADARVGDTITHFGRRAASSLPGYEEATPMVFCGLFPVDADQFPELRDALEKLQLNDAALKIECSNPSLLPEPGKRRSIEEPFVKIEMLTPKEYIGSLMELGQERRGEFKEMNYITENRASLIYELPLAEMVGDFFDQLKSRTKGYASMEYSFVGYRESDLVKLDVQINGEPVEPLSTIVHKDKAYAVGRALTQKLKELIPRQMFKIPIQACVGSKVIASESLSAIRKDVLSKCYGGDISRKKKLLKKQAEGKKRMKAVGKVEVPQEAFMAVLRLEKEVM